MTVSKVFTPRVGAYESVGRWGDKIVFVDTRPGLHDSVRVKMEPREARAVARKLKKWADVLEPPAPRKKTA